jgi:hypothetical protein
MKEEKNFYKCYSVPQKEYLMRCGNRYELVAKDIVNDKKFWLFIKNERLNMSLEEWSKRYS